MPAPPGLIYEDHWFKLDDHQDGHLDDVTPDTLHPKSSPPKVTHVKTKKKCKTPVILSLIIITLEICLFAFVVEGM